MNKSKRTSRRTFIKGAITAGAALAASPHLACVQPADRRKAAAPRVSEPPPGQQPAPSQPVVKSPYRDLRVAFIGTGGIGGRPDRPCELSQAPRPTARPRRRATIGSS